MSVCRTAGKTHANPDLNPRVGTEPRVLLWNGGWVDTLGRWGGRIHRHKHAVACRNIHQRSGGATKKKRILTVTIKLPIRFKATLKNIHKLTNSQLHISHFTEPNM